MDASRWRGAGSVTFVGLVACALAIAVPVQGQERWERSDEGWCEREWGGRDQDRFCEVRTTTVAATGRIAVDAGTNGGVEVQGWDRDEVEVRARVWANARSEERAREIAEAVTLRVESGRIVADGPDTGRREGWGVSYRISVPHRTDLEIETHNGGVDVADVTGDIRFDATNGGVHLVGVAGDVRGRTTNGGLHVELQGDRWEGAGLDAETTNGGVRLYVPSDYSAQLVTETVNGGIDIDFPVTVRGRIGRRLETTLGEGGPTIRVVTTNGGVRIERR